jgi:hypothetical protein
VCFHSPGDLHRRQHKATRRVDHEIDWHVLWRILDRSNYCLGIFQIDVPGNGKAKKAALLLTMNLRDNARPVQFFNCADRLGASNDIPSCREWGLQQRDCDKDPKE